MIRFLHLLFVIVIFVTASKPGFGQCTNPTIPLPDASTPVNGNPATAYCTTLTFDPAITGIPMGLSMELQHTWQGDLSIFITACNNTLMVLNRPGVVASCGGGCPCGNSNDIGSPGSPVLVTFSDGGGPDPENGIAQSGGNYGVTADNSCNVGTVSSFAQLWASCPPGPISALVCVADHAFADVGVAANVTLMYPNPVVCGCTNPDSPNYNPAANVDDGSCVPNCAALIVDATSSNPVSCPGGTVSLSASVTGAVGPVTYTWSGPNAGFLSSTTAQNPVVTVPPDFTGTMTFNLSVLSGPCGQNTTVSIDVIAPAPPVINGPPGICLGNNATLVVAGSYSSYSWSTGSTQASITSNTPGNYSVTVTDANGCVSSNTFNLQGFPLPSPSILGPTTVCQGGSITLDAGPGFSSYLWQPGGTGQTINVTAAGVYQLQVTDANGCIGTDVRIVTWSPPPTPGIFGGNQVCPGGTLELSAEFGYSNFQWSNGSTGATTTISAPGQYSLTATDAQGCVGTNNIIVTEIFTPTASIQGNTNICPGGQTTLTVQPAYFFYQWSNGQSGQAATITQPGSYSVTATTAQGCESIASIQVVQVSAPVPVITGDLTICPGQSTSLNAGAGFASYLWSDGSTGQTAVFASVGTHSVTVSNSNGCLGTASVVVAPADIPAPVISGPSAICPGSSATLNAGSGFSSYSWSNAATTEQINTSTPGAYSVTVSNSEGCTGTASFTLSAAPVPAPVISGSLVFCEGTSTTLNAGPGFSAYAWSNGGNSASVVVNTPGTYTVTVTNAEGCSNTATVQVVSTPNPAPAIAGILSICPGSSTTLNVTGSFSTYSWSTGAQTASITANAAGTYSVSVTDAQGCTGNTSVTVQQWTPPSPQITGAASFCYDTNTVLDAGAGYNAYQWSSGGNAQTLTVSTSGNYGVTVTDQNGCTGTSNFQVTELAPVTPSISGDAALCSGQTSATITASGGYTSYTWSNGANQQEITVQAGGTYSVTVVDGDGCSGSTSFTVTANAPPGLSISGNAQYCQGASTTLTATSGLSSYLWSTGSTGPALTVNAPGSYSLTATDAAGCTAEQSVTVTENPNPVPDIAGVLQICPGGGTTLNSGIGSVSYQWSNGASTPAIAVTAAGNYSLTVTDANGCVGTDAVTVIQVPQLTPAITGALAYCAGNNTQLDAGPGYASYAWSNSANTQQITVTSPGNYAVTVTDANGCSGQTSVSVIERPLPVPQIAGNLEYCEGSSTSLSSTGTFASYNWSTGASSQSISLNNPGNIGLTVTDAFGCTGLTSVQVVEHPLVYPNITGALSFCQGLQTSLNAGSNFVSYQWSNNASTPAITVTSGGNYAVTVTDANGCVTDGAVFVTEFPVTAPQISGNTAFCTGENVLLDAGSGYASYAWSNSSSGQTISITQGGFYSVTATDVNGCVSDAGIQITQNPLPNVVIGGSASFCIGGYTTLNAGAGFAQYLWSDGSTSPTIQVSQPGLVGVSVTDANGCTASDDLLVTQDVELSPVINGNLQFCPGTQTVLDAGPGYATYQWSDNTGAQTVTVTQPGTYTVTVTDAFGCSGSGSVQVGLFPQPQPSIAGTPSFCAGNSTILSSASSFTVYQWSSGSIQPQITVNTPGSYGLTVTDSNGCIASTAQQVEEFPLPAYSISGLDYFCTGASTAISVPGTFSGYQWSGGQQTPGITVNSPGNYSVTVTNSFGCTASQAIQVSQIPLPIADPGPARELTCNFPTATLGGPNTSQGAAFAYQWSGPGITPANGNQRQPQINAPGAYTLVVTDTIYGCVSATQTVSVADLTTPPAVIVNALDVLDCVTPSVIVSGSGSATGATIAYQWFGASGPAIPGANSITYSTSVPGLYTLRVSDSYTGCFSEMAVPVVQDVEYPLADAGTPRHLTCITTADALNGSGSSAGADFAYLWTTAGGNIVSGSTTSAPVINRPGSYFLRVTNVRNGCVSTDSVAVTQDITAPVAIAGPDQEIDCLHPSVQITGTGSSAGSSFRYEWTLNGAPAVISNALALDILAPGTYTLRVINTENGCSASDVTVVTENPERPRDIQVVADDPTCFGDLDGSILLGAVTGGTPPFVFSVNGQPFRSQTFFPNLGAGAYNFVVQDATGCEYSIDVNLRQGNDLVLDLGPDQFIRIGQRAQIEAQYNIPEDEVASFQWNTPDSLECLTCLRIEVRPFYTTEYSATLVDDNGCRITERVTVFVANPREVFIPSAFSPNNDGINDRLMVFAGEDVEYVRSFLVFNRWGESVFEVYDFPPNDPAYGWDGNYRGRLFNSNVFAYFAEVQFIDGSVKLFKGDVTLMK